jgi:hypothetical protein
MPPQTRPTNDASLDLEPYLRVWRIVHPEFSVRLFALTAPT